MYPFIRLKKMAARVTVRCCGALGGARTRGEIIARME